MKYNPSCAMGGTAIETLEEQAENAVYALLRASKVVENARPNARDYSDADYLAASREYMALEMQVMAAVVSLRERLEYLATKRDEREAQRAG